MDGIIGLLNEALTQNNFEAITSILQSCRAGPPIRLTERNYKALFEKNRAAGVLLRYIQANRLIEARKYPRALVERLLHQFTKPFPSIFVGKLPQSELDMIDKAQDASRIKLLDKGGIRRQDSSTKSSAALTKIERTIDSLKFSNTKEIQRVFVDVQKVFILNIITELVIKKRGIEADTAFYIDLENAILSDNPPIYDMYSAIRRLIHEYIIHKYNTKLTPTTSVELLNFIRLILPVLSASMSSYYEGDKDSTDFKIYLPLLANYIDLVLIENYNLLAVSAPQDVPAVIIGIISEPIRDFVRIAGDPDISSPLLISYIKDLIITCVSNFLLHLSHAPTPAPSRDGGSLNRNRTHSRIKKYKNRTKYRTKCSTKYRTNGYKIKNKKTRKVYKY
jgi:hypothetical protein